MRTDRELYTCDDCGANLDHPGDECERCAERAAQLDRQSAEDGADQRDDDKHSS